MTISAVSSAELQLKHLVGNGYFPAELPPPFTSEDFGNYAPELSKKWKLEEILKFLSSPETYSVPRYGFARRKLSVVNPVNQILVSKIIVDNWECIERKLKRSITTEFRPKIHIEPHKRAISGIDFEGVHKRRIEILGTYGRYIKTDIAQFYPSIYTHSIPWAILGKNWVKDNLKLSAFKTHFSNHLDAAVRSAQQGQTVGLPIGPDTSRVLSELIITEIEENIKLELPDLNRRSVRYVDDMYIGCSDEESPSNILSHVSSALYDYGLELNAEKTATYGIGNNHNPEWIHYIRNYNFSPNPNTQRADIDSFFEQACHLHDANHRDNVLLFAIKRAEHLKLTKENELHLGRWMLYCARKAPTCLSFVSEYIAIAQNKRELFPNSEISYYILNQLKSKIDHGHTHEISWLLFLASEIKLPIPNNIYENLSKIRSSSVATITLKLRSDGLIDRGFDDSFWRSFATAKGLSSEMWISAYQITKNGWWEKRKSDSYIKEHQFFSDIYNKDVDFFKISQKSRRRVQTAFSPPMAHSGTTSSSADPYEGL